MKLNIYSGATILGILFLHAHVLLFGQTGNYIAGSGAGTGNTGSYNTFVGYQSVAMCDQEFSPARLVGTKSDLSRHQELNQAREQSVTSVTIRNTRVRKQP